MPIDVMPPVDLEAYQRDGYLVVPDLLSEDEVAEVQAIYDAHVASQVAQRPDADLLRAGKRILQLPGMGRTDPDWPRHPVIQRILAIGRLLNGDDIGFKYDQVILKPAGHDASTPWHQDAGYWQNGANPAQAERGVTCWLALSDVTRQHGCMAFVPGSHRGGIVNHKSVNETSEINNALEAEVKPDDAVYVPLSPGDATFHHARTLHYTSGNTARTPRKGLITHMGPIATES